MRSLAFACKTHTPQTLALQRLRDEVDQLTLASKDAIATRERRDTELAALRLEMERVSSELKRVCAPFFLALGVPPGPGRCVAIRAARRRADANMDRGAGR